MKYARSVLATALYNMKYAKCRIATTLYKMQDVKCRISTMLSDIDLLSYYVIVISG